MVLYSYEHDPKYWTGALRCIIDHAEQFINNLRTFTTRMNDEFLHIPSDAAARAISRPASGLWFNLQSVAARQDYPTDEVRASLDCLYRLCSLPLSKDGAQRSAAIDVADFEKLFGHPVDSVPVPLTKGSRFPPDVLDTADRCIAELRESLAIISGRAIKKIKAPTLGAPEDLEQVQIDNGAQIIHIGNRAVRCGGVETWKTFKALWEVKPNPVDLRNLTGRRPAEVAKDIKGWLERNDLKEWAHALKNQSGIGYYFDLPS